MTISPDWFEEYDGAWAEYRQAVKNGIHTASDNKVRDLHARFATLLSELQLITGELAKQLAQLDVALDTAYNYLYVSEFDHIKTATSKDKAVKVHPKYGEVLQPHTDHKSELLETQWRVKSLETIVSLLSREISARLK